MYRNYVQHYAGKYPEVYSLCLSEIICIIIQQIKPAYLPVQNMSLQNCEATMLTNPTPPPNSRIIPSLNLCLQCNKKSASTSAPLQICWPTSCNTVDIACSAINSHKTNIFKLSNYGYGYTVYYDNNYFTTLLLMLLLYIILQLVSRLVRTFLYCYSHSMICKMYLPISKTFLSIILAFLGTMRSPSSSKFPATLSSTSSASEIDNMNLDITVPC